MYQEVEATEIIKLYWMHINWCIKMDIALFIATRPVVVQGLNTSGVTILKDVVIETFGSMLEQSLMVIVPLADSSFPIHSVSRCWSRHRTIASRKAAQSRPYSGHTGLAVPDDIAERNRIRLL